MCVFTLHQARSWINLTAASVASNASLLSDLDSAIGDGDHGANMHRGFDAVVKKLDAVQIGDLGALFKTVGMTLLSSIGGAAGPLYGGFFLALAKQSAGKMELDVTAVAALLDAGFFDIEKRGKAQLGDKTMVDALAPAITAFRSAGCDLKAATAAAAIAARNAATETAPLIAHKGRASYLGERSIGHQDPGANSCALLMEALAVACSEV
jgi:dihydroxyacetone kinase-like protein